MRSHRFGSILMMAILGSGLFESTARAQDPVTIFLAEKAGEFLLGKAVDAVWDSATGKVDVAELDRRLRSYETELGKVDQKLSKEVGDLRKQTHDRPTKAQVEAIVEHTLKALKDRVRDLTQKIDYANVKVAEITARLGYLPLVPPAPVVRSMSAFEPKPIVDPLMKEWAELLVKSETIRVKLSRLRADYKETSKAVQSALVEDETIRVSIAALNKKVNTSIAQYLEERRNEEEDKLPAHPVFRTLDAKKASLVWLSVMTKPLDTEPFRGHLPVPEDFVGPACSNILEAFEHSGVDTTALVPFFRRLLDFQGPAVGPVRLQSDAGTMPVPLAEIRTEARKFLKTTYSQRETGKATDLAFRRALKIATETSPEVRQLKDLVVGWIDWSKWNHERGEALLNKSLIAYIKALHKYRPTHPRMVEFRDGVLTPLHRFCELTDSPDWNRANEAELAWERFLKAPTCTVQVVRDLSWYRGPIEDHQATVFALAFGQYGDILASAGDDNSVKIRDLLTGKVLATLEGSKHRIYGIAFSPDGKYLVSASLDNSVVLWNADSYRQEAELQPPSQNGDSAYAVAFSPDSKILAVGGTGTNHLSLWDVSHRTLIGIIPIGDAVPAGLAFSPDGKSLAIASNSARGGTQMLGIADVNSRVIRQEWGGNGAGHAALAVAYSGDGNKVYMGLWNSDGMLIYDKASATQLKRYTAHGWGVNGATNALALTPNDQVIVSVGEDGLIMFWDVGNLDSVPLTKVQASKKALRALSMSPDGKIVATGGDDHQIRLWDVERKEEVATIK